MPTYRVTWEIDIDAETPRAAAARAQEIMRDPESIATVFKVEDAHDVHVVDLLEEEADDSPADYYRRKQKEVDELLDALKTETDPVKRRELERRLEQARYMGD